MNMEKLEKLPPPPGIIGSLRAGFDVVSGHVWLILVPILLDLVLWLGPRVSPGNVFSTMISGLITLMKETASLPPQDVRPLTEFAELSGRFNWLSWIRTFPIGVSSLEAYA